MADFKENQWPEWTGIRTEKTDWRQVILEYLRSCGKGGIVVKGSVNQSPVHFHVRHMVVLASIEISLVRAAEKSRFIVIEMSKDISRDPKIPNFSKVEKLRVNFFALALWGALRAKRMIQQLGRLKGYETRLVECYAVPLAMVCLGDDDSLARLKRFVLETLRDRELRDQDTTPEDEERLIENIAFAKIRVPTIQHDEPSGEARTVYVDMTISQLLGSSVQIHNNILQAHGIKICEDGIFLIPGVIERKLLKDTPWRGLNIGNILKRIPGAENARRRVARNNVRGVLLPKDAEGLDCGTMERAWNSNGTP